MTCYYCETTKDLRPYGPKGALVCFKCAMATPERAKTAEDTYYGILDSIEGPAILTDIGPTPMIGDTEA